MRALKAFCDPTSSRTKEASVHGHSREARELVLLDALTGEAFRFPFPVSPLARPSCRGPDRGHVHPTEEPEACFWWNLENYVQQLIASLPSLAPEEESTGRKVDKAELQQKDSSRIKEPHRYLCFVEATGRSLSAEAAAAAAWQAGSISSKRRNIRVQSNGPLSLILLRPEVLSCLEHSSRSPTVAATVLSTSFAGDNDGANTAATATVVSTHLSCASSLIAPKALTTIVVDEERKEPVRKHPITCSVLPTAGGGDFTTCRGASIGGFSTIPGAVEDDSSSGLACACNTAGYFSFPSASMQQRLVSGELKALRAAALLDGDASFKVFGSNVAAAAPLLSASRDAAAVAADLHMRLRRQRAAAEVIARALLRHAELALKWSEALQLRVQQQGKAQEGVIAGFEELVLKLQQTPLDPALLLLQQLKHDDSSHRPQEQTEHASKPAACDSTGRQNHRGSHRREESGAVAVAAVAAGVDSGRPQKVVASGRGTPRAQPDAEAASTKSTPEAPLAETGSPAGGRCSPTDMDSGRDLFTDAFQSPDIVSDGSDTVQQPRMGTSAVSEVSSGSLASAPAAAACARSTPAVAAVGAVASSPGEQGPPNTEGLIEQQKLAAGSTANVKEISYPATAVIAPADSRLGKGAAQHCWIEGSHGGAADVVDVLAAGACTRRYHRNPMGTALRNADEVVKQKRRYTEGEPLKGLGTWVTSPSFRATQPGPPTETKEFDANKTARVTVAAATTTAAAGDNRTVVWPSAASLLDVPAIRAFAESVFADRAAVLQQVELLQEEIRTAAATFRAEAYGLLAAADETGTALSTLLGEQQELTAVHTRAFAAVVAATPAPPIAYSRFAPEQLRALAADQGAAMEELQQLEQKQKALTKEQKQAWIQHCSQQLELLCFCLRARILLRQYHKQGLAYSSKAQRVNAALLQLRRLYACPAVFAAAARETIRRLIFAASIRKAAETARAVLQRMQQQEQQQRLAFLESAAPSLPVAVFWPLLRVAPHEAHVTVPEIDESLISIVDPSALTSVLEEAQQQKYGKEREQQTRQQHDDRVLLRALLRSELARSHQRSGNDTDKRQQQQQRQQQ